MLRALLPAVLLASMASAAPALTYRAELVAPAPAAAVVRDLLWQCAGTACSAPFVATSSDATVCAAVARKLGRVTAFAAGARVFAADELDRCNAGAR